MQFLVRREGVTELSNQASNYLIIPKRIELKTQNQKKLRNWK